MAALVLVVLVLVARLVAGRAAPSSPLEPSTRRAWIAATVAVAATLVPVMLDAPLLAGARSRLVADASTHLAIAQDIARHGLPHGWIPTYNGGFPIALHYPPVGWLATAGLLRLGVPPVVAVKSLGLCAFLAVPLLVLLAARLAGMRAASGAAGAVAVAWVTPYIQFTGGWEVFFVVGLLSQALVVPGIVAWVAALATRRRFDPAPVVAALCAATHPQVFAIASVVIVAGALASGRRELVVRTLRSVAGGGLVAAALYVPGIRTMTAPFGWPPDLTWRHIGFGGLRILEWVVEGDLLDYRHGGAVTGAWCAACIVHVLRPMDPRSRALVASSIVTLALSSSGPLLAQMGGLGTAVLSVFQPMRALAVAPLVAAATIIGGLDAIATWLGALRDRLPERARGLHVVTLPGALAIAAVMVLPPRMSDLHAFALKLSRDLNPDACAPPIEGFSGDVLERWLATAPPGRIAFETDALHTCAATHGGELRRSDAMASSFGAGAHVGVHAVAFDAIAPAAPGSAARAEALGVRTLIHTAARRPGPAGAWELVERSGDLEMSRRAGGTGYVGVGCVHEVLLGRERDLSAELFALLRAPPSGTFLDRPERLIELRPSLTGPRRDLAEPGGCDASGATVREVPREPGAFEAEVETPAEVDVVFRVTAFSGWHVYDRGSELVTRRVAPGFVSVRVGPGRHHLEAIVRLPWGYAAFLTLAVLAACMLGALEHPTVVRLRARLLRATNNFRPRSRP